MKTFGNLNVTTSLILLENVQLIKTERIKVSSHSLVIVFKLPPLQQSDLL